MKPSIVVTTQENLPLPTGYTARPGSPDDVLIAFDLFNAAALHLTGAPDLADPDVLRTDWSEPRFDMPHSTRLVFAPDGSLAGYVEVVDINNPPVHPWIWACVHPAHFGRGVDAWLLAWAETRAWQALERVPNGLRFAPRTGLVTQDSGRRALLEAIGWRYNRSYYRMETTFDAPPVAPPAPEGITIRPYRPETELEEVVRTMLDSFRDHFGFVERPLEEELTNFRHHFLGDSKYDPSLWLVAMHGEQMAGICICRPEDYENPEIGFVNELGVRREFRKRGIATALLKAAFAEFHRRGRKGAALGVDADSLTGALKIYTDAGMRPARQFDNYEKELRPGQEIATQTLK